jgi:hypothetical protein
MNLSDKCCDSADTEMECVRILKSLGSEIQHDLFRVLFYEEGRMEVEFQARNPWECLVLKLDSWKEVLDSLKKGQGGRSLLQNVVIRKKCTKCFLHERAATTSDI